MGSLESTASCRRSRVSHVHTKSSVCMLQVQTPEALQTLTNSSLSIPPSPWTHMGRLLRSTEISELIPFHLRCGLQTPCLRFTDLVPHAIFSASGTRRFTSFLFSKSPPSAQNSVLDCWLSIIDITI